ncbi:hypothetical protein ATI61_11664 [Archangium gephyra]|uniref:Transporter n=1 Tax=Archangium gephyra TaxID=48 RepID=A0AAC8QAK3_9BACT|nr:hypothetical protein [Archangium gephyra]AKJ03815.1 Hypothetical protein AA314_05441 [Archangium gephyra]REG23594.1 hypothetical protein ATI61_11664 [Archangium gephyra]
MSQNSFELPAPILRPFAALALTLVLASGGALAQEQEAPTPPAPEAAPPPPEVPVAEPAPDLTPPEPPAQAESSAWSEEWKSSGFGFPLTTLGTERFQGRFYEVGVLGGLGGPLAVAGLESAVALNGVHIFENRGYVTKFTVGMLTALAVGLAGNKEYVGSETSQYGGYTVRTDYYRLLTPDEIAERNALPGKAMDDDYAVELSIYAPRMPTAGLLGADRRSASGFELYIGGPFLPEGRLPVVFQWGLCASYIGVKGATFQAGQGPNTRDGANAEAPHVEDFHYANAGLMLRLTVPVTAFVELRAQWDLNVLQAFGTQENLRQEGTYHTSPFRLGAVINLSDRLYGSVTGTLNGLGLHGLGVGAEAGFRL